MAPCRSRRRRSGSAPHARVHPSRRALGPSHRSGLHRRCVRCRDQSERRTGTRTRPPQVSGGHRHEARSGGPAGRGPDPHDRLADGRLGSCGGQPFLSTIGFPCVTGFLELDTTGLADTGLRPVAEPVGKPAEAESTYFSLGSWQGARLLLDGRDGSVLQDGSSGIDDALAGSSLSQFVAMVRLYYWWFASDWSIEDTETDVRHWLNRIDPQAFRTQGWQRVFEDYNFDDRV
ncbi:hypothetical protein EAO75_43765 [Streptomyces sp. uw30]|uniref:SUKH-4 family immunity protein n=1 Tax=Streptomyces sp. uw30 TaxID=1828179 RepID=UPI0011CE74A0|nr:hypothetical protein EAO75_43765 [Streptomyces sp. uw30]